MATDHSRYLKWIRYSGASVVFSLNPLHWSLVPRARREYNDGWPSPNERTWRASWLFVTVRFWVDDGSW